VHRFLFMAPEPANFNALALRNQSDTPIKLAHIFAFIHRLHNGQANNYIFSHEAQLALDAEFNLSQARARIASRSNLFTS
jgi:hypothetical protein